MEVGQPAFMEDVVCLMQMATVDSGEIALTLHLLRGKTEAVVLRHSSAT